MHLLSLRKFLPLAAVAAFLVHDVSGASVRRRQPVPSDGLVEAQFPSLLDASLEDLAGGLETGLFTSVDLVEAYIARILEVNDVLKAVREINPDALAIAEDLDAARANGTIYGPLHGIPILIKDNIATADKMETTAGSYALVGARVPEDSTVVRKLRKAGAIVLGKASMSEWAGLRSWNSSTTGWSPTGGQTMGAYVREQSPSDSSSGSGVASSVGLAFASLGTETSGSIISPASYNNIVGIKPTVGITSRHLVVPFSSHQDTVGPMARTVKDAAYLLAVIAGADPKDNHTTATPFKTLPDYVAACQPSALSGKRIGVLRSLFNSTLSQAPYQSILLAFNEALDTFREAGATIVDDIPLRGLAEFGPWPNDPDLTSIDFVRDLPAYLAQLTVNPHNITSVADLIAFTQRDPREDWPNRDTVSWERALADAANTTAEALWNAYIKGLYLAGPLGISGALRNHSLDVLVSPTITAHFLPATLGSPVVTVPLGAMDGDTEVTRDRGDGLVTTAPGMPFGIAFSGERWSEEALIGIAYAFEQRTMVRRTLVPYLMPGVEVGDVTGKRG